MFGRDQNQSTNQGANPGSNPPPPEEKEEVNEETKKVPASIPNTGNMTVEAANRMSELNEAAKNPPKKEGPRKDPETGEFMEGNTVKYYQKSASRPQIEKDGKMIFADDFTECGYYTDLNKDVVTAKREAGEIF